MDLNIALDDDCEFTTSGDSSKTMNINELARICVELREEMPAPAPKFNPFKIIVADFPKYDSVREEETKRKIKNIKDYLENKGNKSND